LVLIVAGVCLPLLCLLKSNPRNSAAEEQLSRSSIAKAYPGVYDPMVVALILLDAVLSCCFGRVGCVVVQCAKCGGENFHAVAAGARNETTNENEKTVCSI
jgi:hypothetical protein